MAEPTKRQALPWPWWRRPWREFVWGFDLDDGTGDGSPSLTKWLAFLLGLDAALAIPFGWTVTGSHIALAVVAISAAFGRSAWKWYLGRASFSHATTDTTARTETRVRQEIIERRDATAGVEPAP